MEMKDKEDKKVEAVAAETALMAPERISKIVAYVLDHYDQKTKKSSAYKLKRINLKKTNECLAKLN